VRLKDDMGIAENVGPHALVQTGAHRPFSDTSPQLQDHNRTKIEATACHMGIQVELVEHNGWRHESKR
jgi:hypothetical protein